jgi:heme exporter protein B
LAQSIVLLKRIAPGIIWVAALLASLMSIDNVFRADYEDGTLELMVMTSHPLSLLVLAKVIAHWLLSGVPLLCIAPLMGVMLHMDVEIIGILWITLLLGMPVLSLIGGIAASSYVRLKSGGILVAVLVLPLYVPILIFASSAVDAAMAGLPVVGHLSMMCAILCLAMTLTPLPTAVALKMSLS